MSMKNNITMKQMCEHIVKSRILKYKDSEEGPTAEEIFNYSPTGELSSVFEWYEEACLFLGYDANNEKYIWKSLNEQDDKQENRKQT